ncbi:glutamate racemase [Coxiella endosymbiont of Amblyomma americanum]|uniref:glutamate racemase n=1 Tax=Coxiella endosymbiont of Amblyomma americanum TaxID=325775 RepID=UPI000580380E|nr:glutamate racemase [Coxiella endosymbiont of Amblyomma americanum]AJC50460.1 glutamate racemase [Coxiella endosymbiont of Amblyomma americanum]AUJ58800.1 glutamate racemase [Coxiella-like endosymbiont of Amblyomma americanum]
MENYTRSQLPIGVFDSGVGGLTVLQELINHLPSESYTYLGDTARVSYGTKSCSTIVNYAIRMASLLVKQGIKLLVVACNTVSAVALSFLKTQFPDIPIVGVIEPGAREAVNTTKNNRVVLLATETTIRSGIYPKIIFTLNPNISINSYVCGLFVALAEEGCINNEIAMLVTRKYLEPVVNNRCQYDSVILGCTHFPIFTDSLVKILGKKINIINTAMATAVTTKSIIRKKRLENTTLHSRLKFLVTDSPERFARIGEIFLGRYINPNTVYLIDNKNQ